MEILVKKSEHRVDPKDPEHTDPTWARAYKAGQRRIREGKLQFQDRGDEEAYWKAVSSNPGNVPGMSPFFPALPNIRSFVHLSDGEVLTQQQIIDKFRERKNKSRDIDFFCPTCDKVTSHAISLTDCFCHDCGRLRPERIYSSRTTYGNNSNNTRLRPSPSE